MGLKGDFPSFLTMIIKLLNNTITASEKKIEGGLEKHKCVLIMNSDSTATLTFFEILEFRSLELLSLVFKLGDAE